MTRFALVALVLVLAAPALANDASVGAVGAPYPAVTPNRDIRMVSEVVTARILGDTARVTCAFVFRNEGRAQRVRIGFPEDAGGDVPAKGLIRWFRSYVNDRQVPVKRMRVGPYQDDPGGTFAWWVKEVEFGAGETKWIRNEYEIRLSENVLGIRWFTYVLHTGASWKGRVGEATITVDLGAVAPATVMGLGAKPRGPEEREFLLNPAGARRTGGVLRWHLANFEPTKAHDVMVAWRIR